MLLVKRKKKKKKRGESHMRVSLFAFHWLFEGLNILILSNIKSNTAWRVKKPGKSLDSMTSGIGWVLHTTIVPIGSFWAKAKSCDGK